MSLFISAIIICDLINIIIKCINIIIFQIYINYLYLL